MSRRRELDEREVQGLSHLRKLLPLLERLREVGCERDKAGNRRLHMDQYCGLVLLMMFNPVLTSLRSLQQASTLKKVQKKLGCGRASLGSLSEATRVFAPEPLKEIIGELAEQTEPIRDVSQRHVDKVLLAVDGSLVNTLSTIAEAAFHTNRNGEPTCGWRLHTQFEIDRCVPRKIDVTPGKNAGENEEKAVLRSDLRPDCCYVMDRWYAQYQLFNQIESLGAGYVCRVKDNVRYEARESQPLGDEAIAAGVLSDEITRMGARGKPYQRADHPVRLVSVRATPRTKTGSRKGGPGSDGVLRIATNLLDPPPEIIAEIYRERWSIEVFFKFFKHVLGCRHLIAQDENGIRIQVYCAIIACLLLSLWTGRKPTLRTYEMVCFFFTGLADEQELLAHLATLKPHAE